MPIARHVWLTSLISVPAVALATAVILEAPESRTPQPASAAVETSREARPGATAEQTPAQQVSAAAVSHVMSRRNVTRATAQTRLDWQDKAAQLQAAVQGKLGERAAGVWVGDKDDRLKVGVLGSGREVREIAADLGVANAVDVVPVKRSMAELDATYAWLLARLEGVNAGAAGPLEIALAVDKNAVELQIPPKVELTKPQQTLVAEATQRFGAGVRRVAGTPAATEVACDRTKCNLPLRGGVRMYGELRSGRQQACTIGLPVRSRVDGARFVLTAGHCTRGPGEWFMMKLGNNAWHHIGQTHRSVYGAQGDVAIIRIAKPQTTSARVIYIPSNAAHGISAVRPSVVGQVVCQSGASTGVKCGKVQKLRQTQYQKYPRGVTVGGLTQVDFCADNGDSGAPVFRGGTAFGIMSGKSGTCGTIVPIGRHSYYTELAPAMNLLRVGL